MEQIYVINDQIRQAVIAIIEKGVHPAIPFDQLSSLLSHLKNLKPVQVLEDNPEPPAVPAKPPAKVSYRGPDNNCCGEPEETAPV